MFVVEMLLLLHLPLMLPPLMLLLPPLMLLLLMLLWPWCVTTPALCCGALSHPRPLPAPWLALEPKWCELWWRLGAPTPAAGNKGT